MANFPKKVEDATNTELLSWVNQLDFRVVHLASDELTRRSIKRLNESIDKSTVQSKESSDTAERFTAALFLLAVVQLLVALFQLILSFAYSDNTQYKVLGVAMVISVVVILNYFAKKIFVKKSQ